MLEEGIVTDFALVRAARGDRHGNLVYDASARNFNPLCAMAGRITIAEVEELVEPGEMDPEHVDTPGVFVQRVVEVGEAGKRIEKHTTRPRPGGDRHDAHPQPNWPRASPRSCTTAQYVNLGHRAADAGAQLRRRTACTSCCSPRTASSASGPTRTTARRTPT